MINAEIKTFRTPGGRIFVKLILNAVLSYRLKAKDFYILNGNCSKTQELFKFTLKLSIISVKMW